MQGYSIHHMLSFKKDDGKNVDASLAVDLGPRSGGGQGQFGARFASPKGAKTSHENCRTDKDTVICSTEVEESYQNTLQLTVRKVEGEEETWEGAVVIAGNPRVIGRWTLPKGSGNVWILGKGEVDYAGELSCAERPFNSVSIGAPTVRGSPPGSISPDPGWDEECFGVVFASESLVVKVGKVDVKEASTETSNNGNTSGAGGSGSRSDGMASASPPPARQTHTAAASQEQDSSTGMREESGSRERTPSHMLGIWGALSRPKQPRPQAKVPYRPRAKHDGQKRPTYNPAWDGPAPKSAWDSGGWRYDPKKQDGPSWQASWH